MITYHQCAPVSAGCEDQPTPADEAEARRQLYRDGRITNKVATRVATPTAEIQTAEEPEDRSPILWVVGGLAAVAALIAAVYVTFIAPVLAQTGR